MFRGFVYPLFFSSLSVRTLQISCVVLDVIYSRYCVVIIAPVFFRIICHCASCGQKDDAIKKMLACNYEFKYFISPE